MISEAERIAGELTEAQRRALTDGVYVDENWTPPRPRMRAHGKVKWNLCCRRLLRDYIGTPTVTPLGLEVKRILEEKGR